MDYRHLTEIEIKITYMPGVQSSLHCKPSATFPHPPTEVAWSQFQWVDALPVQPRKSLQSIELKITQTHLINTFEMYHEQHHTYCQVT